MVFEVSYVDPAVASPAVLGDDIPPALGDIDVTLTQVAARNLAPAAVNVLISARVSDAGGLDSVTATYTTDGTHWKQATLQNAGGGLYQAIVEGPPQGGNIFVIVEARATAGNVATDTAKGQLFSIDYKYLYLPLIRR
jgi:hypothetical protein